MIRSMTGYSRVQSEEGDLAVSVSVKSTNHRFLDLQVRLPAALESLEPAVRRVVKDHVARGHVEITGSLEWAGLGEVQLNRKLLDAYLAAYGDLRNELGLTAEPDLVALLRIPRMVEASDRELSSEEFERVRKVLERTVTEALACLNEMRAREGKALEHDLRTRLVRLQTLSESIANLALGIPQLYQRRLENRLRELLVSVELDATRLAQEVAYLASRSDIAEELTRFRSHLDQARRVLEESSEAGKKLDFLLQEMNREANTLLSKTTDVPEVGLEISRQAIDMKTEIEKLREQAQNIE